MSANVLLAPYQSKVSPVSRGYRIFSHFSPIKLVEYLVSGRAIVSTDFLVLHEVLTHGETGLFVPGNDAGIWSRRLLNFVENGPFGEQMEQRPRALLETEYTWVAHLRNILSQFVLGSARRPD